jgi:KDO2-lipid IV(A) lauroyltransferase
MDYGIQLLMPKGAGTRELMRALGRGQSIALMNDQKFNEGISVPLFGHNAMTAPGPTRLAMKFGAPLLPMSVKRIGTARYRCTVHEPFMPETGPDDEAAIFATVSKINRMIEGWVREAPEQWFWMHNRWPKQAWIDAGVM